MARDPSRIRPLLNQLAAAWEQYPDLRLGQLLEVMISGSHGEGPNCLFHIEDDLWERIFRDTAAGRGRIKETADVNSN